jgi:hypothetical protein
MCTLRALIKVVLLAVLVACYLCLQNYTDLLVGLTQARLLNASMQGRVVCCYANLHPYRSRSHKAWWCGKGLLA